MILCYSRWSWIRALWYVAVGIILSPLRAVAARAYHRVLDLLQRRDVGDGLTDMQRLLFAAILVNEIGPVEKLGDIVSEPRRLVAGSVHEGLVEGRLARAGVQVA